MINLWNKCKDRMPDPDTVVECRGSDISGVKLKWAKYSKPIRKKTGIWMWECFSGTPIAYWTSYPRHREIVEWRKQNHD